MDKQTKEKGFETASKQSQDYSEAYFSKGILYLGSNLQKRD